MLDISVIIPFKNKSSMSIDCLASLNLYCDSVKEILLINNNSASNELAKVKKAAENYANVKVLNYDNSFNFQAINNWAARKATGKVLFLLNNDTMLTKDSRKLILDMYEKAQNNRVGAVGCVLLYPDKKTIQHAGVYLVPGGTADHLYIGKKVKQLKQISSSKKFYYNINKNMKVTAVTAAALMVEKIKYNKVQGMNENFIICGGDVDLCLRLNDEGYQSLLVGFDSGYIVHKESRSRSMLSVPYVDFFESYKSYVSHFDIKNGDKILNWGKIKDV